MVVQFLQGYYSLIVLRGTGLFFANIFGKDLSTSSGGNGRLYSPRIQEYIFS